MVCLLALREFYFAVLVLIILGISGPAMGIIKNERQELDQYCKGSVLSDLSRRTEDNDTDAMYELGLLLIFGHCLQTNLPKGLLLLKSAVSKGHIEAAFSLGDIYADKSLPEIYDVSEAQKYLSFAADNNHVLAQHILGIILIRGDLGIDKQGQGLYWLGVAASGRHTLSAIIIAHFYEHGKYGIVQDPCLARDWYELCLYLGVHGAETFIDTIDANHTCK